MKVFHVTYRGNVGGSELYAARALRCLKEIGCDVNFVMTGVAERDAILLELEACQIPYSVLGCRSGHDIRLLWRFLLLVWSARPDILHFDMLPFWCQFAIWFLPRGTHVVSTVHCPVRKKFCFLKRFLLRKVEVWLPVSRATERGLLMACPNCRSRVLYNPIEINAMPEKDSMYVRRLLGLDVRDSVLGMVARMDPQKKWKSFCDVSFRVLERYNTAHAIAVGDGVQFNEIKEYWNRLCADNVVVLKRMHWMGRRVDAKKLIGGMDVFLLLSEWEEMPTTLLEAFGMHTPVVGNIPVGGVEEVLAYSDEKHPVGRFSKILNVADISSDVINLLHDRVMAAKFTGNAFSVLKNNFDADIVFKRDLLDVYKGLLCR